MKKRTVSYRLILIVSLLSGILLNLCNTNSALYLISYYTLQSNVLCLIIFSVIFIFDCTQYNYHENTLYYIIKGMATTAIMLTAIVYFIALLPNDFVMYTSPKILKLIGNALVHIISPIMVIIDYILFDKKGNFKLFYPLIWLYFPLQYVCFVYIYNAGGGHFYNIGGSRDFAYFFLDYNKIGKKSVLMWVISIAVGILILGYILIIIDKLANYKQRKKNP